ncbi:hypothetical protein [Polyangium fumosum]|uniref:ATP-binding protein n=1 Tax=Polyangium fumosum TaxID=889272 RepID=A0A4U1IZZ5_9BACT|nr:hypothetical protein [Polyangium fumosum]TKD00186.1 hypothetical protein E8A74_35260 [Polyangium fumosum]
MTVPREDLKRFYASCDPNKSLSGTDERYVSLDRVRGSTGPTCVDLLEQTVLITDESCQLFTGFPGTGKTTELRRLKQRFEDAKDLPTQIVYVDLEEYIDIFSPIAVTDVLRILAYCMDREATRMEGGDPDKKPGYLQRFIKFLEQTNIELPKGVELSAYGATLMLEFKNNPDFYQRAEKALSGRFQLFVDEARLSIMNSVVRLKKARGSHAQRVVVIADGLEKMRPRREQDREAIAASVELLFSTHAPLLRLPCHVIYTFPLWLRYRRPDLGATYDGEPLVLPMVKVTTKEREPVREGIDCLTTLVGKRLDVKSIFGDDTSNTLDRMILATGGYPRDLLRLVRNLLTSGGGFPATPEQIERQIERLAQDYAMALYGDELDVLVQVAEKNAVPLSNDGEVGRFIRLLDRWLVLAYRNGKEWYDLHPMARRDPRVSARLKKPSGSEPSGS